MDKDLEEQLERVRQLSERVSQIHEQLAENTELITRDRESLTGSPLTRVRDFRPWTPESRGHREPAPRRDQPCEANHRTHRSRRSRRG